MAIERPSSIANVARFLGASEDEVIRFLEEGRLGGALIAALNQKGLQITPGVKNSVERVVRTIDPETGATPSATPRSQVLTSEATATIMFTDVVGSSAMTERLGDRAARDILRTHNEIVRRQTREHGGVEVKSTGDGFMLTFPSARSGVACAVAVQRELDVRQRGSTGGRLEVRMGLSVGEPIREDEDLFGHSVILAARISAQAVGGQALASEIVYALLRSLGEYRFRELGTFELRDISGAQSLYEVLWRAEDGGP